MSHQSAGKGGITCQLRAEQGKFGASKNLQGREQGGGKQSCGKVGSHTLLLAGGSFCPGGGSRVGGHESALLSLSLSLRLSLKNHQHRMSITSSSKLIISCQLSHTELSETVFFITDYCTGWENGSLEIPRIPFFPSCCHLAVPEQGALGDTLQAAVQLCHTQIP